VSESSARTATQLLKQSSENWCPGHAVRARIAVPVFFNEIIKWEKYLRVERAALLTHSVICEL
jgi:hypothetical protein